MRKNGRLIHIVVALPSEARPIVRHLSLQRLSSAEPFDTYYRKDVHLIVSGIGKIRSAIATTVLASRFPSTEPVLVNVGLAGAVGLQTEIGALWLAHQVIDAATRREFYPDRLSRADLPECTVVTHDRAVHENPPFPEWGHLVEMEASGFMEAASRFTTAHSVAVMKIVSDFLDTADITRERVEALVESRVNDIADVIHTLRNVPVSHPDHFNEAHAALIDDLARRLRLTQSQRDQVQRLARSYVARIGHLEILSGLDLSSPKDKNQRNRRFKEICELLVRE